MFKNYLAMILSKIDFLKARDFIITNARMIERRLFEFYFANGNKQSVYHAVYAYRNADGGFGHGMEPDTASPESQPLFGIMALELLDEVGYLTKEIILNDFFPYFDSVTTEKGGIPWMFKPTSEYPCEEHFKNVKAWGALSTTAPLLGFLEKYEIDIPWMEKAEQFVWSEFDRILPQHAYCYLCVPRWLNFLRHTKHQGKARIKINALKNALLTIAISNNDKSNQNWGLYGNPHSLNYAPSNKSILYPMFSKETLDSDLNTLISKQKKDGRWATSYGISEGSRLEWDGMQTLWVLKVLNNYRRIEF